MGIAQIIFSGLALLLASTAAHAGSATADQLVENLNKAGKIVSPAFGSDACPCSVVGTASKDGNEIVFVASQRNAWWLFTCISLSEGGSICMPQQLFGSTIRTDQ